VIFSTTRGAEASFNAGIDWVPTRDRAAIAKPGSDPRVVEKTWLSRVRSQNVYEAGMTSHRCDHILMWIKLRKTGENASLSGAGLSVRLALYTHICVHRYMYSKNNDVITKQTGTIQFIMLFSHIAISARWSISRLLTIQKERILDRYNNRYRLTQAQSVQIDSDSVADALSKT
jgi:hypothetical protein